MRYEIKGDTLPVVICHLEAGERMITERGSMAWMSPNMKMETSTNGGFGKAFGRMFSGEAMFQNIYTAQGGNGLIAFASSFPGSIKAFEIGPGQEYIFQKKAFLAGEPGVNISVHFHKKVASGLFGGEGFILQKVSGNGIVFAEFDGHVVEYELQPGQQIVIDSGYLAVASGVKQAFSVGFDEGELYNEVDKAAEIAKKAGIKHHVRIISKQEFWDALPDVMYHMDEPLADASAVALYFLSKEAAGHVKVVLSGEGADELFGGYNIYREPESLKKIDWIPFGVRRVIGKLAAKLPDVKGRDFLIRAGMKVEERFIGNAYIYREKEKAQILKNKVTGPSTQEYLRPFFEELESENRGSLQDMEKMQSVDLNYWLPGDILQKADKMSMAHSLEVRVPFLDKEVFNFAAKLPKEAKIAAGTTKYIFRKAVSEFLPQETDERRKLGFPIPIRVWLRQDDWYQMVKELFTSKEAEEFFHTDKLLLLLKEHKEKKADNSRKIWTVLTFLIWYDRFFATCSK